MSICVNCGSEIQDEILKHTYYDPDYPDIHIGPYCRSCIGDVIVCTACHHPHTEGNHHLGDGVWVCESCKEAMVLCTSCGKMCSKNPKTFGDDPYCDSCYKKKFGKCDICGKVHKDKYVIKKNSLEYYKWQAMFDDFHATTICLKCFRGNKDSYEEAPVRECENCGSVFNGLDKVKYCPRCMESLPTCEGCGEKTHKYRYTDDDTLFCEDCYSKLKSCQSCGRLALGVKRGKTFFGSGFLCDNCLSGSECKSCKRIRSTDFNGICAECHGAYGNTCYRCGRVTDRGTCRVCGSSGVYNYSFKPTPFFNYIESDPDRLFFGFENEVTFSNGSQSSDGLRKLYEKFDPTKLVCKSDSSIRGSGFEIVSQPMTLRYLQKSLGVGDLFQYGMEPSPSCGLHVHVDRRAFISETHLWKVVEFIYSNEKLSNKVAGRSYSNYNSKISKKVVEDIKQPGARTSRVNLTNKHTVEFRMFAGCVRPFQLLYRVEFLHALISWAELTGMGDLDVKGLFNYIKDNKYKYYNIYRFLRKNYRKEMK